MSHRRATYVALACTDAPRVAGILRDVLELPLQQRELGAAAPAPVLPVGDTALALFEPDDPFLDGRPAPGVRHVAIASDAPQETAAALGLPGTAAAGGEFRVERKSTGGTALRLAPPLPALSPGAGAQVQRIDHLGVASADNHAAEALFVDRLGCPLESTQTDLEVSMAVESFTSDRYGVVYHSRPPVPVGGLRVSFISLGDFELEFLQPFDPAPEAGDSGEKLGLAPGNTRGDRGAIGRYLQRHGPGLHHLALKTPDIQRTLDRCHAAGLRIIDRRGRPGSRRALIGFVHPGALGGLLLHFVEREELTAA